MYKQIPKYEDFYELKLVEEYWDKIESRVRAEVTVGRFLGVSKSEVHLMFTEKLRLCTRLT